MARLLVLPAGLLPLGFSAGSPAIFSFGLSAALSVFFADFLADFLPDFFSDCFFSVFYADFLPLVLADLSSATRARPS